MKKKILNITAVMVVTILLISGGAIHAGETKAVATSLTGQTAKKTDPAKAAQTKPGAKTSNFDLLQGKWQNVDDKTNFVIFEKNQRKEISEGMEDWDETEYALSDVCKNDSNKGKVTEKEKDRYISLLGDDLCCYIEKLDATTLSISYMGRGNTFTYKRVK